MSSTRPKPRPRPRARAAATAVTNTDLASSLSPGPSSTAPPTQTAPALSLDDEDALFLRNRTRDAQAWKELSKMTEEKKMVKKRRSGSSDYSGSENVSSPKARARKKKHPQKKNDTLPDWTKKRPNEIVISSDSDDDDIGLTRIKKKPAADGNEKSLPIPEARSRSLTPPPGVDQLTKLRAQQVVQRLVGIIPRAPSPTECMDESMDTIVLDPELASIAQRVHKEAEMRGATPLDDQGGPEQVQIKVLWKPHPLNPEGRPETWGIEQKRHDNFYRLFDEVADLAGIRTENLVICYDAKRVFPSSSPHSVKIWATATFEAYDKVTYQYLQENKRARSMSLPPGPSDLNQVSSRARSPSVTIMESEFETSGSPPPSSQEQGGGESQTFKLIVRSERTKDKDITLTVRPTTKCGAIVRAFLKKAGLEAEYPEEGGAPAKGRGRGKAAAAKVPALSVDGDRMDAETEIGEADLEDGDQVEVVGL